MVSVVVVVAAAATIHSRLCIPCFRLYSTLEETAPFPLEVYLPTWVYGLKIDCSASYFASRYPLVMIRVQCPVVDSECSDAELRLPVVLGFQLDFAHSLSLPSLSSLLSDLSLSLCLLLLLVL